jgi:hypothetical protein
MCCKSTIEAVERGEQGDDNCVFGDVDFTRYSLSTSEQGGI